MARSIEDADAHEDEAEAVVQVGAHAHVAFRPSGRKLLATRPGRRPEVCDTATRERDVVDGWRLEAEAEHAVAAWSPSGATVALGGGACGDVVGRNTH